MVPAIANLDDPHISLVDMTNLICDQVRCPAAVGGVPVYYDVSHLTATYSRTLAPYLEPQLIAALQKG
jgi:hypothetical protein